MTDTQSPSSLSRTEFRSVWRIVTLAGLLGTAYYSLAIWGVPRVKFLRAMGATPFHFGVLSAVATLTLGFQVFSGMWASRLRRRKPVWIAVALLHRLAFIGVLVAALPFFPSSWRVWWIIGASFLHDGLANLGAPMWFAWMTDLMPATGQNRAWGGRQRVVSMINTILWLAIAFGYNEFEKHGMVVSGYVTIASVGLVMGILDILLFVRVPEPEPEPSPTRNPWQIVTLPLRDSSFRPFMIFSSVYHFAVLASGSFYALYMVEQLHLKSRDAQLATALFFLGMLMASRLFGLLCDVYGKRPVLAFTVFGRLSTALALTFAPQQSYGWAFAICAVAFLVDGIANVGVALAFQGLLLQATPRHSRAMYIAAANFLTVGTAGTAGPLLAGWFIDWGAGRSLGFGPIHMNPYQIVFLTSAAIIVVSGLLALRVHDYGSVPLGRMLSHLFRTNPLRVASAMHDLHEDDDERKRVRAARILGAMRTPLGITGLISALEDSSRPVRRAAANSLGKIGMGEAARPLVRALSDPNSEIQSPAARALARIGDLESRQALIDSLTNLEPDVLEDVVDSLARLGDTSAIAPLICLFRDIQDERVREKISDALITLGEKHLTDELLTIMVRKGTRRARRF